MNKDVYYPEGPANAVQPIALGGTGAKTVAKAAENLGLLTMDTANQPNGPLLLNATGVIGDGQLPADLLSSASPLLHGVPFCFPNGIILFKVTNFDSFTTYTVSSDSGSVSILGDEITFVAGPVAKVGEIVVNGYQFAVTIQQPGVQKPSLVSPANASQDTPLSLTLEGSTFVVSGMVDTHFSSEWEVATDASFTNIVMASSDDQVHKLSIPTGRLNPNTTYYAHLRYVGLSTGASAWSDVVVFTTGTGMLKGVELSKVLSKDASVDDFFGTAIALNGAGDQLAVGAAYNDPNNRLNAGSIEVFQKVSGSFIQRAMMRAFGPLLSINLNVAHGGSLRVIGDGSSNFDHTYTENATISVPPGAQTVTINGRGAVGVLGADVNAVDQVLSGSGNLTIAKGVTSITVTGKGAAGSTSPGNHWTGIAGSGWSTYPMVPPGGYDVAFGGVSSFEITPAWFAVPANMAAVLTKAGLSVLPEGFVVQLNSFHGFLQDGDMYWHTNFRYTANPANIVTTGAASTVTANGVTTSFPGGVGGAASSVAKIIALPGSQETTLAYTIASGGALRVQHDAVSGAIIPVTQTISGTGTIVIPVNVTRFQITGEGGDGTSATIAPYWQYITNIASGAIPGGAVPEVNNGPGYAPTYVGERVQTYQYHPTSGFYTVTDYVAADSQTTTGVNSTVQVPATTGTVSTFPGGIGAKANPSTIEFTKPIAETVTVGYTIANGKTASVVYIIEVATGSLAVSLSLTGDSNANIPAGVTSVILTGKGGAGTSTYDPGQSYIAPSSYVQWQGAGNGGWDVIGSSTTNPGYPQMGTTPDPAVPATGGVTYVGPTEQTLVMGGGSWNIVQRHLVSALISNPGRPYIAPTTTYTTGPSTTATLNGITYTFQGGYGGMASEASQVATIPSAGVKMLSYSVAGSGSLRVDYSQAAAVEATELNLTGSGSFVVPNGVSSVVMTGMGGVGGSAYYPGQAASPGQPYIPAGDTYSWSSSLRGGGSAQTATPSWTTVMPSAPAYAATYAGQEVNMGGYSAGSPGGYINYGSVVYTSFKSGTTTGQPYIPPTSYVAPYYYNTYGANTTVTYNGVTSTFDGGYGGPATAKSISITLPLAGNKTISYVVASGGTLKASYGSDTVTGAASTAVVNGQTLSFAGGIGGLAPMTTQVLYLDEQSLYGSTCAMSKDGRYLITGAAQYDINGMADLGIACISEYQSGSWVDSTFIRASDGSAGDNFGYCVDINDNGSMAVVGAPSRDGAAVDIGAAYLFQRSGNIWTQFDKAVPPTGNTTELFGARVAIAGNAQVYAVSALGNDTLGVDAGAVYVYTYSNYLWNVAKLVSSDGQAGDGFGSSIRLSDDGSMLFVGAPLKNNAAGAVYVFTRSGLTWTQLAKLTANDSGSNKAFGSSLDVNEVADVLVVGSQGNSVVAGAVYVFSRIVSSWTQMLKVLPTDGAVSDQFGGAVALSAGGDVLAVGSTSNDTAATNAGAVYLFK